MKYTSDYLVLCTLPAPALQHDRRRLGFRQTSPRPWNWNWDDGRGLSPLRGPSSGQADQGILVRKVTALQKSYSSALRHPKLP